MTRGRKAKPGRVVFVGSGPGDPGLLTRLAVARLRAEHDGQWGIDIRLAWREHAERHAAPAIVARGALEIREFCGL